MGGYVKKKKDMVFQSVDSLQQIVNVVNEAAAAVNDSKRTIKESAIPEVLAGALGAGIGGVGSFAALYGLGVVGLSAAGITSGLAAAGAVVGGGMVAGIFVLAAPIAALAAGGVGVAAHLKNKQLRQEKERLYKEVLARHEAIIKALKDEADATQERLDYLQTTWGWLKGGLLWESKSNSPILTLSRLVTPLLSQARPQAHLSKTMRLNFSQGLLLV